MTSNDIEFITSRAAKNNLLYNGFLHNMRLKTKAASSDETMKNEVAEALKTLVSFESGAKLGQLIPHP